jgi:Flp pilus assembly protein TadG
MVEFALTLPLLALMLFGIIQYGFLFAAYITVRNASAVGARYYAIHPTSGTVAENQAKGALSPMLVNSGSTATAATTTVGGETAYSMTVTYDVPLIIPFVVPGGGSAKTLTATTVTR